MVGQEIYTVRSINLPEGEISVYTTQGERFGLTFAGVTEYEAYGFSGNSLLLWIIFRKGTIYDFISYYDVTEIDTIDKMILLVRINKMYSIDVKNIVFWVFLDNIEWYPT